MADTVKIKKGKKVLEVTKKAYEVVYKEHGFEMIEKKAKQTEEKDENNEPGRAEDSPEH